ncbi:scarecrow-like protein 3 [Andrographis paniculata]|uniref:scarecrow-like protein 3 n=1 Tax=Andrographis paniculata TaxID=175694 RepID=UPI0021E71587|nr:scarecrow-like protein 3 [Andrographis paniculata]
MAPYSAGASPNDDQFLHASHVEATKQPLQNFHASFEILNKYGSQMKRLRSGKHHYPCLEMEKPKGPTEEAGSNSWRNQEPSAASFMRMAKMELIQLKAPKKSDSSNLVLNTCGFNSSVPYEHKKHMKHAMYLLGAVERFSNQQYHEAEMMLQFILPASYADHPVERVITRFAQDLRERIDAVSNNLDLEREVVLMDVEQVIVDMRSAIHTSEQRLPLIQITHFTAIQMILDHAESSERIHIIDFGIQIGSHWITILQALANRKSHPLRQLKITVVCKPKEDFEETGKLLTSFAEYMSLPFVYKTLHSETHDLKRDQFELEPGELVAVYLECCLISLSEGPQKIEALIQGIKTLSPHLMVVNEVEAYTSGSTTFIDRFDEALFICCAMFDCLDHCLERGNQCRELCEKIYFQEIIRNGVMNGDEGNFQWKCTINFWREYLSRFGLVETPLSQRAIHQASLMIQESPLWHSCTMTLDRECLLLGWDSVPLRSVSAWKFQHEPS